MSVPVPANLRPFVRILGTDGAIDFLLSFGGSEVYFAVSPKGKSRVEQMVGYDKAAALCQAHLPSRIPTGKPWIAAVWHARGLPKAEIARRLHVADKTVRSWLNRPTPPARPPDDPRQPRFL
ncbi:helix-turn-helix domain-containing protein [Pseudoruegeria sp. HB172150]|uniref:helix-turn-helix domain-containing protein n=1 Tax=Pseudoruegeria sp. HB172150 TaxID=2721164 RepID=UPI001555B52B|nr:helix-turn-helix domain-containing protein [Pseudoruegeria sp. HB172150]